MKESVTLEDINNFLKLHGIEWDIYKWRKYYRKNYIQDEANSQAECFYGYIPLSDGNEKLLDVSPIEFIIYNTIAVQDTTFEEKIPYSKEWVDYQLSLNSNKIKDTIVKFYLENKIKLKSELYYSILKAKAKYDNQIETLEDAVSSVFSFEDISKINSNNQEFNTKVEELICNVNSTDDNFQK